MTFPRREGVPVPKNHDQVTKLLKNRAKKYLLEECPMDDTTFNEKIDLIQEQALEEIKKFEPEKATAGSPVAAAIRVLHPILTHPLINPWAADRRRIDIPYVHQPSDSPSSRSGAHISLFATDKSAQKNFLLKSLSNTEVSSLRRILVKLDTLQNESNESEKQARSISSRLSLPLLLEYVNGQYWAVIPYAGAGLGEHVMYDLKRLHRSQEKIRTDQRLDLNALGASGFSMGSEVEKSILHTIKFCEEMGVTDYSIVIAASNFLQSGEKHCTYLPPARETKMKTVPPSCIRYVHARVLITDCLKSESSLTHRPHHHVHRVAKMLYSGNTDSLSNKLLSAAQYADEVRRTFENISSGSMMEETLCTIRSSATRSASSALLRLTTTARPALDFSKARHTFPGEGTPIN